MPKLLSFLLPFVPVGYRTAAGVVLIAVGTALQGLASPELLALLPHKYAVIGALLQGWGAAAAAIGIRFAGKG